MQIAELPPRAQERSRLRRPPPPGPRCAPAAPARPGPRQLARVLVSDDDPAIRELLARLLADHGFAAALAPRGDAAATLELALRSRPQLLITDVNKPGGLDGLALRDAIRADRRGARLPILVVSAVAPGRPLPLGPRDDFMLKPFGFAELVERAAALIPLAPAEHDALAAHALARCGPAEAHPVTGLPGLAATAAALPAATASPGWSAAALQLAGVRPLLRAHGRPWIEQLRARLGGIARAAAPGLLVGHIGLDGQIALVGPALAVEAALAEIAARFAPLAARLARAAPGLPAPALALRRPAPGAPLAPDLLALRLALR